MRKFVPGTAFVLASACPLLFLSTGVAQTVTGGCINGLVGPVLPAGSPSLSAAATAALPDSTLTRPTGAPHPSFPHPASLVFRSAGPSACAAPPMRPSVPPGKVSS